MESASVEISKIISFAVLAVILATSTAGCDDSSGSPANAPRQRRPDQIPGSNTGGIDSAGVDTNDPFGDPFGDPDVDVGTAAAGEKSAGGKQAAAAPELSLPPIYLSEQHQATCLIKQGDVIPDFELADVYGESHKMSDLFGDRLTAVCFWSAEAPSAVQLLQDLGPEVIDVFGDDGVAVVTINYGQSTEEVQEALQLAGSSVQVLMDHEGAALAQVATRYLPRIYLLDNEGKVIWFDLEYSSDTRRHLHQAIRFSLAQP